MSRPRTAPRSLAWCMRCVASTEHVTYGALEKVYCLPCLKATKKRWAEANPEKRLAQRRRYNSKPEVRERNNARTAERLRRLQRESPEYRAKARELTDCKRASVRGRVCEDCGRRDDERGPRGGKRWSCNTRLCPACDRRRARAKRAEVSRG